MAGKTTVKVDGLAKFAKGLRKLGADLPKGLRVALNQASEFLIDNTLPKIPKRSGRAAGSLKARSSQKAVRIAVGGRAAPYYPFLDFGGHVGPDDSVARPFFTEGRYLYPTLREHRDDFTKIMQGAVLGIARDAGLDVD